MDASNKWIVRLGVASIALAGACLLAFTWWLPSDKDIALRLSALANERFGIAVSIESVGWALLPTPSVTVHKLRTDHEQPISFDELTVYPNLRMLLQHKLVLKDVDINGAVIPRNTLHALSAKLGKAEHAAAKDMPQVEHAKFRNITWISYSDIAIVLAGEIDFDPDWRPRHAEVSRPETTPPFTLTLTRESNADRWKTQIAVGGGTAHGHLALKTANDGTMQLSGELAPRDIEVASAVSTFNRRSPVGGKGAGQTVVSASGKSIGELARSLHTQTRFTVNPATVLRFDLDKAISTGGKEHGGHTDLQELTGQLDTQNGAQGMRMTFTDIRARAGKFTATGNGTVYHRQVEGSGNLDLVEGAVGVPFTVSGPVQKPKVSVPPGFFAGAAIGTVVLPGIGTAIGARIGGAIGQLFDGDPKKSATK